jgi:hypothetical protein
LVAFFVAFFILRKDATDLITGFREAYRHKIMPESHALLRIIVG